jgi:hypothetical protein
MGPIDDEIVGPPYQHRAPLTPELAKGLNVMGIEAVFAQAVIHLQLTQ